MACAKDRGRQDLPGTLAGDAVPVEGGDQRGEMGWRHHRHVGQRDQHGVHILQRGDTLRQ
jgi:hypothetical protein